MKNIMKWGFGMAPLKESTQEKNRKALINIRNLVLRNSNAVLQLNNIPDDLSRVKGIFNRTIKQDQWDWFTVYMYLDYPPVQNVRNIVSALASLRIAIIQKDDLLGENSLKQLQTSHFDVYCDNYLNFDINSETPEEYLYILSRREERDVLKIGMTTRNVQKRVNEINSATGVVYPLSARKVFKVKDGRSVEKAVHVLLAKYRMRSDREFFLIDYAKACAIIDEYLTQNHLYYYD